LSRAFRLPGRFFLAAALLMIITLGASWLLGSRRADRSQAIAAVTHDHGPMTADAMERWVRSYYAAHPARGATSFDVPSDSFLVQNFNFDENFDGAATQVDTAKIFEGQTILWKLVGGSHTVTNGTGSADPQAGTMFDQPLSSPGTTRFTFQFNTAGTYPFFCRPHEGFNMKGVVKVQSTASVTPGGGSGPSGFLGSPWPNPTRGTTSFRFALATAGHARAEAFDVRGRRVATVMDRDLAAGSWTAAWDGRVAGRTAPAGVYYLRLAVPGRNDVRSIIVER